MPKEFTFRAFLLGSILAVVLGAANAYLGLFAGMTVSASIPAAVISMAVLRGVFKKGTILENNIVQSIGSSGESLAAGVIFTIPALVITTAWHEYRFWPTTLIAMTGGILGILFMIPLRRALIVEEKELAYPEGVACAEVLKAGDQGGKGARLIFLSILVGAVYKFMTGGMMLIKATVEGAARAGSSIFYVGASNSLALTSVGYIVGFNVGSLVFLGGLIGWAVGIPIYTALTGDIPGEALDSAWKIWSTKIRYMGVGAMAVGGLWTILNVRKGVMKGLKKVFGVGGTKGVVERTEQDMGRRTMLLILLPTLLAVFLLYRNLTGDLRVSGLGSILMIVASFFFVAVASYIVGLVGSSNSPVSGMTICSLLFAAVFLRLFGFQGMLGVMAVLGIAGVVCCAVCSAGDISQDLKTGYLVKATPYKQQLSEIVGAIVPAFFFAPILSILHSSYGIGVAVREGVKPLVAPQATLFAKLSQALFLGSGELPMNMVYAGMAVAVGIILLDLYLKSRNSSFRTYVMAVAVGIYLPLELSTPIFLGGLINRLTKENAGGVLIASGLIAGESLMGVLIAILIFTGMSIPITVWSAGVPGWLTPLAFVAATYIFAQAVRKARL